MVARNAKAEGSQARLPSRLCLRRERPFQRTRLGDEMSIAPEAAPTDLPSSPQAPLPSHWQTPKSR